MVSDNEQELHPLEALALSELPWEVRVKRVAAMAVRKKFGYLPHALLDRHITPIVEQIREPWGRKGLLRKELKKEIQRQRGVRRKRAHHKRGSCSTADYSIDFAIYHEWSKADRRKALAQKRIGTSYRPLDRKIKWRRGIVPTWNVRDARVSRNTALMVLEPSCVHNGRCFIYDEKNHRVRYLFFKAGDVGGNVRISIDCETVDEAIHWLKRTSVLTAEKKSYAVEIDWEHKCFRVKSPRRKKWREIPFKSATRKSR